MSLALRPLHMDGPDCPAFINALANAGLSTSDLAGDGRYFAAVGSDGTVVGYGGLDGGGPDQMIRSVVIPATFRGRGYGRAVVEALVKQARAERVLRLWLLTTSADRFFAALGWAVAERAAPPESVRASRQFTGLCPSSAVLMCLPLA